MILRPIKITPCDSGSWRKSSGVLKCVIHNPSFLCEQNEGNVEEINNNASGSDMDGEINEDDDFAPLPPFDFQRESEEIRRTAAPYIC